WLELGIDVKAEEEAKRTSLVQQVMAIAQEHMEAQKKIQEFEWKANVKIENFTIKLLETALDRLQVFK
ncbi:hypothetical protein COK81_33080, partial [Bacillus thuringiensis]